MTHCVRQRYFLSRQGCGLPCSRASAELGESEDRGGSEEVELVLIPIGMPELSLLCKKRGPLIIRK
jgi:hypothetical protein